MISERKADNVMINVCDIHVMKPLLAEHGFHFSKAKGQNFLTQRWVPESIALESGVDETVGVLEIGPGIGPLTQQLCLRAKKVCAVELDTRLEPILKQTVGAFPNLEILWGDILKQDILIFPEASETAERGCIGLSCPVPAQCFKMGN